MANKDHLAKLSEGVESWNKWRVKEFSGKPDLKGAILRNVQLIGINLSETNLSNADLTNANLFQACLIEAKLRNANLSNADLSSANLAGCDLTNTIFTKALLCNANFGHKVSLSNANLTGANLHNSNLSETNLSHAILSEAKVSGANLIYANLYRANLYRAFLNKTDLTGANLGNAILERAKLISANLCNANLSNANLTNSDLIYANLSGANLRGADLSAAHMLESNLATVTLTGACIEDWNINSTTRFNAVTCEYIYFKHVRDSNKGLIFADRLPRDPNQNFEPGEFTKLFQKIANAVELVFHDGLDWEAFAHAFHEANIHLQNSIGGELTLREYKVLGDGLVVLTVEIPPDADEERIQDELSEERVKRIRLEGQVEGLRESHFEVLRLLEASRNNNDMRGAVIVQGNQNFNNNMQGANIANFANVIRENAKQSASQFSQTIEQNADEIAKLIETIRRQAQQFPEDRQDDLQIEVEDLQRDLSSPDTVAPNRIRRRLTALLMIAGMVGNPIAIATDFTNNVLDLGNKFGIPYAELIEHVSDAVRERLPGQ